ncbi:MAG: glycosyltransferase family 2 protein [Clostridia bacterium]|nr:glycosyltransferase family 2 protein [Clostridia bacterium]
MSKFEVLCVTMHQKDFSKIEEMNIHSNVVFANQADTTAFDETEFEGKRARMITTATRGVGINRNLALTYADADICLFADDDVKYVNNMEELVLDEFDKHPDADVFIFHLDTDDKNRKQISYKKTRKHGRFERMPWGGVRIAVRLSSVKKTNVWFTTLFGGGCIFPSGEDSMWLLEAKRKGLKFYVSDKTIGKISFEESSWFTGFDEKFYFSKGVYCQAMHPKTSFVWRFYYAYRYRNHKDLSLKEKMRWMKIGKRCYTNMLSFDEYKNQRKEQF